MEIGRAAGYLDQDMEFERNWKGMWDRLEFDKQHREWTTMDVGNRETSLDTMRSTDTRSLKGI